MRRILLSLSAMVGLCGVANPAWATCNFAVTSYATSGSPIDSVIKTSVQQWQNAGADVKISTSGGAGKVIHVAMVQGCSPNHVYYFSSIGNGAQINMCDTQVINGQYVPVPWGFSAYADSEVVSLGGFMVEVLGLALGVPYSGNTSDVMYPQNYNGFATLTAADKAALKNKYPAGSCTTKTDSNTPPKPAGNDKDGDGIPDAKDNCPTVKNPAQEDMNKNGLGDYCDNDVDGDALLNDEEIAYANPAYPGCKLNHLKSDTDNDKLIDGQEVYFKTNPCSADTDGDAIGDYDEIKGINAFACTTDPFKKDSDGDKLSDGDEIKKYGTNPCKDGDKDGDLLSDALEILVYGTEYGNPKGDLDKDGLSDADEVLKYKTSSKSTDTDGDQLSDLLEIQAYKTDPLNAKGDLDKDGLTDVQELKVYNTFAEEADSDGDKLLDGEEVKTYKTNPLKKDDTDQDGLYDGVEIHETHTNRIKADTDDDGLIDGDEVSGNNLNKWTSDPKTKNSDSDGIEDGDEVNGNNKYSYKSNPKSADSDADGLNDNSEVVKGTDPMKADHDVDTILDGKDNCPLVANLDQKDSDGDGTGDTCQKTCDAKCSKLPACQVYEAKKKESFGYDCKLAAPTAVAYLGEQKNMYWKCEAGEACFCALPIFLNDCAEAQAACEAQYCNKNEKSKTTYQKLDLAGECETLKTMGQLEADGKKLAEVNSDLLFEKMVSTLKLQGAVGLVKVANPVAAQLGYYLGTQFGDGSIYTALNEATAILQKATGDDLPPNEAGQVLLAKYVPPKALFFGDKIVYNETYMKQNAAAKKFDPISMASTGAHEGAHAFIQHLVMIKDLDLPTDPDAPIKVLSGISNRDIMEHKIMALVEFALAEYDMEGTGDVGVVDATGGNFGTAQEMIKKKAKWQSLQCTQPSEIANYVP